MFRRRRRKYGRRRRGFSRKRGFRRGGARKIRIGYRM